ncbi:Tripartite tricarboxylate transporter family receptor [Pigmentiphaga humi]|uniref:Tripartite tricarboxylate transporter family receptor n=1 Tax=Pigmentiphaga humi TaxID=2478468 RepID=A0A3P4B6B9_9BURK|nr:tripartite tricarboxylate transporter substrate binding protein [Pigmentiphaga humi]VCU71839.1 Tripartite tricarboxylate transporter family receptor [Pigmentiphaga humi]
MKIRIALLGFLMPLAAAGADFPSRPLTIVVPFGAGGTPNLVARLLAEGLAERIGQPVVVQNKPGASGVIAAQNVMHAPADGYTILLADNGLLAINPSLNKTLPYSPTGTFAPLTQIVSQPFLLYVRSDLGIGSVDALVSSARRAPGKLNYGSVGNGSPHHLCASIFASRTGTQLTHIPFKSVADIVQAMMGKEIDLVCTSSVGARPLTESGRARALAIATPARSPAQPDAPTFGEAGISPPILVGATIGLLVRSETPRDIVEKLGADLAAVARSPSLSKKIEELGMDVVADGPAAYARVIQDELKRYADMVGTAGVTAN